MNWKHSFFGDYETQIGLVYEGRSGRPFSYIFSGDALIGAGVAVGGALLALVAKSVSLDKKNDKLEKKLDETWYHNGILVGRLAELRNAEEKRAIAAKDARINGADKKQE